MDQHLDWQEQDYENWLRVSENQIEQQTATIANQIDKQQFLPEEVIQGIYDKIQALQQSAGYNGTFMDWVDKNLPERLEDQLEAAKED